MSEMSQDERRAFIKSIAEPDAEARNRRADLALRRRMLDGNFEDDVKKFIIGNRFRNKDIAKEVAGFASNIFNPMKRLSSRVAVLYKHRAARTISEAKEEQQKTFAAMCRHVRIDRRMKTINRDAWAMNTVIVVPTPFTRNDKQHMRLRAFAGDTAEVIRNKEDPFGLPEVLGYVSGTSDGPFPQAIQFTTIDAEAWRTWDLNGKEIEEAVEHDLGEFPGSLIRMEDPPESPDADYWHAEPGMGLRDTCLEVGYMGAKAGWVRKGQDHMLLFLLADMEEDAEGNHIHPEAGMKINADPQQVQVLLENFDLPVTNFMAQMSMYQDEAAEVHDGVPSTFADPNSVPGASVQDERRQGQSALTDVRENQEEEFNLLEHDLIPKLHKLAMGVEHELALPEEALESFHVQFAPLQSIDSRKDRLEIAKAEAEIGASSAVGYVMSEHGIDTREEAISYIMANLEDSAKFNSFKAKHQSPNDIGAQAVANDGIHTETPAEEQGRKGGFGHTGPIPA